MRRQLLFATLLSMATLSFASSDSLDTAGLDTSQRDSGHSIIVGGGVSIPMLGSWERRGGGMLGYSMWTPEPRVRRLFGANAEAVWTFYGMYHEGIDGRYEPTPTWLGGFNYGFRKSWENDAGRGFAYQLYWGGNYASARSRDLPSSINSTPGMVFSWLRPLGARGMNLNLQYEHMSNGGTVRRNRGENFFLLELEFKLH